MSFPQTGEGFSIDLRDIVAFILELGLIGVMLTAASVFTLNVLVGDGPISSMGAVVFVVFLKARDMLRDWRRGV